MTDEQTPAERTPAPVEASKSAAAETALKKDEHKKADERENIYPFSVNIGQVYDGPLDLLLDLIRKQDLDIYDIPIAKITAQFLVYVER